jgi:hypothetical protein
MVVRVCLERLLLRIWNRQRLHLSAGDPMAHPNAGHTSDAVPIFAAVDPANRLHTGN